MLRKDSKMANIKKEAELEICPVTRAELQSAVIISGRTETNLSTTKIPGLKLWTNGPDGEWLHWETPREKGKIPATNAKICYEEKIPV